MDGDKLRDKVALITGASRGIGRAVVWELARQGAVPVLCASGPERLAGVAEALRAVTGRPPLTLSADLAEESAIQALVAAFRRHHDRLDILVNNAGVTVSAPLAQTRTADWDRCLAVNARGPFLLCRECLPLLRRGTDPCIVNVCSVVGVKGYAQQSAYTASKHALRGLSLSLAEELAGEGIRVHTVCPGGVDTDMVREVRPDIPREELITPEEVAEAVAFLVARSGQGLVDEIRLRRRTSRPWF